MRENTWEKAKDLDRRLPDRLHLALTRYRRGGQWIGRVRRGVAVILLAAAGALALLPERTPATEQRILAVTRDLQIGTILARGDLTLVDVPSAPDGALRSSADAVGKALGAPVRRGEVLTDIRLADGAPPDAGPGRVAVPVSLPDPAVVDLLHPGTHVTVVSLGSDHATGDNTSVAVVVARDAVVLTVVEPADAGLTVSRTRTVLLGVRATEADRVMGAVAAGAVALRFG